LPGCRCIGSISRSSRGEARIISDGLHLYRQAMVMRPGVCMA